MSHSRYNPFTSGNQTSTQGQYGLSGLQGARDPRLSSSPLGPGPSFNSSGFSSGPVPDNSGRIPTLISQSLTYRPEQSRAGMDDDIERSVDMHISRAREEVRVLSKAMHEPRDQDTRFISTQRDEFRSSGTGITYPVSSTSAPLGQRLSDNASGRSSLDWLSNYKGPTADDSQFYSSSASSSYASSGDARFNAPTEREHDRQSIPGLGDYPVPEKPTAPQESSRPKYTSQSAVNILLHFGLEKEDLEQLISYPEDQITPANLPFILRQIRIQKSKRTSTASQSKPYPEPQPTRRACGMGSESLGRSGGGGMSQDEIASAVLQPSKVIDYGHTGKYTGGAADETGKTGGGRSSSGGSGSTFLMDSFDGNRHSQGPLPKSTPEVKSDVLGSSHEQATTVTSLSSPYRSVQNARAPPSLDQTKRLQAQPNQTPQPALRSFFLPKKDTDIRVLKPEAPKPVTLKEPVVERQSTSKTQPPNTLFRGVHPSRPGLVLIDSKVKRDIKDLSKSQGPGSTVSEQTRKQQEMLKQSTEQQLKQQQTLKQPVSQTGQANWPPVPWKPVPFVCSIPNINVSQTLSPPGFIPSGLRAIVPPPALLQPISSLKSFMPLMTSSMQPPAKVPVQKSLPSPTMMCDYAAASPKIFPHTCSLCKAECFHMKDWISHQNTSLHLENCRHLRTRFPEWDGEITVGPRSADNDPKPSTSTSAQSPQKRHLKTRQGSRSPSRSRSNPRHHYHGSESRRENRDSRSPSPYSSRYTRRSRSRSRSWSRSPSRSYSPWYDSSSSRYRSRSRSPERRLSPRKRDEKWPSPRRSRERRTAPRKSDKKRTPPRRSDERRTSPRRSDKRRSSPRRSREERSSTERSSPQQRDSSAERLAKTLLGSSGINSLSKSELDSMIKTLAPALVAHLNKITSSSSSSSTAKKPASKTSKAKPCLPKSAATSSTKTKSGPALCPAKVRLGGIFSSLSHTDVATAVERFAKPESVVLFRSKREAVVRFEKEEDADKLRSVKSFDINGLEVFVAKEADSKEQKKAPQKKPATSSVSKPQTTSLVKATTGKVTTQKVAAKGAVKGPTTVAKSKVLVSKMKNISTIAKTTKAGTLPAAKTVAIKQKTTPGSASAAPKDQPDQQKPVPKKSGSSGKEPVVTAEKTAEVDKAVPKTAKDQETVTKAKVVAEKVGTASSTRQHETLADKSAGAGAVTELKVEESSAEAVTVPSMSTESGIQPDEENPKEAKTKVHKAETVPIKQIATSVSKPVAPETQPDQQKTIPEKSGSSGKESVVVVKETVPEKEETASTSAEKSTVVGAPTKEKVEETPAKVESVSSISTASESQPGQEKSEPKEAETKVQETLQVTEDKAETVETPNHEEQLVAGDPAPMQVEESGAEAAENPADCKEETLMNIGAVPEDSSDKLKESQPPTSTAEPEEADTKVQETVEVTEDKAQATEMAKHQEQLDAGDAEPMQVEESGAEAAENPVHSEERTLTTTEAVPEDKPRESQPPTRTSESHPTVDSAKAPPQSTLSKPQSSALGLKTKTEASPAKLPGAQVETKSIQKDPVTTAKNQTDSSVTARPPAAAAGTSKQKKKKMMEVQLNLQTLSRISLDVCFSPKFLQLNKTHLLITKLPRFYNTGCYTEKDIANLMIPYGFNYVEDRIHIIPHICAGIIQMPTPASVLQFMTGIRGKGFIPFKGNNLFFRVLSDDIDMSPLGFYKFLMKMTKSPALDDEERTIFIKDISQSEIGELRKALNDFGPVKNFMPLLNKVFVEFHSNQDVDRFGASNYLKSLSGVHRLKVPVSSLPVEPLMVGEKMKTHLHLTNLQSLNRKNCFSPKFKLQVMKRHLVILNLPPHDKLPYTETDIANLFIRHGFQYVEDSIHIIPQSRSGILKMPTPESVLQLLSHNKRQGFVHFNNHHVNFRVLSDDIAMSPLGIYKLLMKTMKSPVLDDGERIIFIKDISQREILDLRKMLREFGPVENFMPLLNKVFVEFCSPEDVDRFVAFYKLKSQHEVHRLNVPTEQCTSLPPSTSSSLTGDPLTIGEMMEFHIPFRRLPCIKLKTYFSPKFFQHCSRQMMSNMIISNLPVFKRRPYTEEQLASLIVPLGFKYVEDSMYVDPQSRDALIKMPTSESVLQLLSRISDKGSLIFHCTRLRFSVLGQKTKISPLRFYKLIMAAMKHPVLDDGERVLFIKNISGSEIQELRKTVAEIAPVKNFMPLLNKVFVEFHSNQDADRVGALHSLQSRHQVHRLKVPTGTTCTPPLKPPQKESSAPNSSVYFRPIRTAPFLFSSSSPWFNIPDHLTVTGEADIKAASSRGSLPTIMLTGLPVGNYSQVDVAALVWRYFPRKALRYMYYNVMVLTLQRRAFVFFTDWKSCCDFARDQIANKVSFKLAKLEAHFVLEPMSPESSEEMMYKTAMEWSNLGVPDPETLEERLLCVRISLTSVEVIRLVMEAVASVSTFVSFLPLGNRICVEMAEPSGVKQVLEKSKQGLFRQGPASRSLVWKNVVGFETVKNLKKRIRDDGVISKHSTSSSAKTQPPPSGSAPALPTSGPEGSTRPEPVTAGPSAASSNVVETEEGGGGGVEPEAETSVETAVGAEAHEEKLEEEEGPPKASTSAVSSGNMVPAAPSSASSSSAAPSCAPVASELPRIDENLFNVIAAAVRQHRLAKESGSQRAENVGPSKSNTRSRRSTDKPQRKEDFTEETLPPDRYFSEQPDFNMDDFVTVDEVGDDDPNPPSSSSSPSSTSGGRKRYRTPSPDRERSSKNVRGSSSASPSTSRSTKGSSSSVLQKKSRYSPSARVSKPSSSPLSAQSPSSPAPKTQQSKVESQPEASSTTSSGYRTRSSSATQGREEVTPAAASEASTETPPVTDHKVAAETTATKTAESEPEMNPPPQGPDVELSPGQSVEIDSNTLKDRKKSEEEEDDPKRCRVEEDQMLDALDDPTDEQMCDGDQDGTSETQPTGPEEGPTLHEETFQVLDSVDDEGEEGPEQEMDGSLDRVSEDQAATGPEDSRLVQDNVSTIMKLSEEDEHPPVDQCDDKDEGSKEEETNFQVVDTKEEEEEEVEGKVDSAESCKDVCQIPDEEQPHQDNKDDVTEEETFEILDSIDDQTATEEDSQTPETPSQQVSKEDRRPVQEEEEEEDTYQVIDSVEDQPATTETEPDNMEKRTTRGGATGRSTRSSSSTTTASKTENKEKPERTVEKYETRRRMEEKEATEEMVYEIVDSVEDESVQDAATTRSGRRRSARGKKEIEVKANLVKASEKPVGDDEATYQILDSVEDETVDDKPTVTRRSTRGRSKKDALNEKPTIEDAPTRRRRTPARESQERKSPKTEEKAPPKETTPTKKSDQDDATYKVLDSVEDEVVKDHRPTTGRKRGRPKKAAKATKKDIVAAKEASEKVAEEEETMYQILDSVEDETTDDPTTGRAESSGKDEMPKHDTSVTRSAAKQDQEEEEEAMFQIVDSLEDDQEEPTATDDGKSEEASADKGDAPTTTDEEAHDDPSAEKKDEESTKLKSPDKNDATSTLENLDQVSDEEEDYPDDTAEEEELRRRQAAVKEKQAAEELGAKRRSRERRSSSRGTRRAKERDNQEEEEELVTLDEVGEDEAGEETELHTLVTLDEFVEEEQGEEEKEEHGELETRPLSQEDESVDSFNPETLVTLDEAGADEVEKPDEEQAEETSKSAKRKHEDTEESMNFVTVDEVGEEEEEEEVTSPKKKTPRGSKRSRPVRRSGRTKKVSTEEVLTPTARDEEEEEEQEEEEAARPADTPSAGPELQLGPPENQTPAGCVEEGVEERWSRPQNKAVSKLRKEPDGPEAKRSRSQSPSDFKLPPFKPHTPLGREFVVPKSGFFCNLCCVFYLNETTAKELHCSSRRHFDNLQKHYRKMEQKGRSQGSVSD